MTSSFHLGWRLAALRNGFRDATAYRIEFLFEFLGAAVVPAAIQWVLWYALFIVGGKESVAGMGYYDMVSYTLMSLLFTQVRGGDHDFELQELIRNGSLSNYLLKPVSVVEFIYVRGVSSKLVIAGACLVVGCLAGYFFGYSPLRMFAAMFVALMGNVIHYQLGACLATTAFYWEEAYSILMVKNLVVQFLCGELIPLNLFPEHWQWVWKSAPFHLYVYTPVQIALGRSSWLEVSQALVASAIWMAAVAVLLRITWALGFRHYQSIGG